jgi:hypothetical protein
MKYAQIFALGTILAMLSLLVGGGCTSLGKVGDGKLEPVTKGAAKAALTAASAAAPEYAAVLKRIQAQVERYGETKAEADRLAGFAFTRTYFLDGNPIPDPARLTWVDKWEKTESAGEKTPPKESKNTASVDADEADDALAAAIAALLEGE